MFIQQVLNGLAQGSMYALAAVGMALIIGTLRVVTFAHGEVFMLGAFIAYTVLSVWEGSMILAVVLAILVSGGAGVLIEYIGYRKLRNSPHHVSLLVTIGFSIIIINVTQLIWGAETKSFPRGISPGQIQFAGLSISSMQVIVYAITLTILFILQYVLKRTKIGRAIRATSQDHEAANVMGVNINRIYSLTFALGSALGGLGGVMVGIYYNAVYPTMGAMMGLKAFSACILGGLSSVPGAFIAGIFLGVVENLSVAYVSPGYRHLFSFLILILVLIFRPNGLFGRQERTRA